VFQGEIVVYLASNTTEMRPHKKSLETWQRSLSCCGQFIPVMAGSNQLGFGLSIFLVFPTPDKWRGITLLMSWVLSFKSCPVCHSLVILRTFWRYIMSSWQPPKQTKNKCGKAKYLENALINQIHIVFEWWGGYDTQEDKGCYKCVENFWRES
jgi:hypothetical protein